MHDAVLNPGVDKRDVVLIESLKGAISAMSNLEEDSIRLVTDVLSQREEKAHSDALVTGQMAQLFGLLKDHAESFAPQVWFKDVGDCTACREWCGKSVRAAWCTHR